MHLKGIVAGISGNKHECDRKLSMITKSQWKKHSLWYRRADRLASITNTTTGKLIN